MWEEGPRTSSVFSIASVWGVAFLGCVSWFRSLGAEPGGKDLDPWDYREEDTGRNLSKNQGKQDEEAKSS